MLLKQAPFGVQKAIKAHDRESTWIVTTNSLHCLAGESAVLQAWMNGKQYLNASVLEQNEKLVLNNYTMLNYCIVIHERVLCNLQQRQV